MPIIANIGRAIVGGFFVLAGINKILNYDQTIEFAVAGGVAGMLIPAVICLEVIGGLIIALGRPIRLFTPTAYCLAAFTLLTNIYFHRFWEFEDVMARLELSLFFKNLAIMGALLCVATYHHQGNKSDGV